MDLNINGTCDTNEPTTTTDSNGKFTFSNITVDSNTFYPVIVSGGVDTATGKNFEGEMKNVISSDDISSGKELTVTPLSDLVATSFLQSSTKDEASLNSSKSTIANALGVDTTLLDADTMQDTKAFAKAQEVQQIKELIKTTAIKATGLLSSSQEASITTALVDQLKQDSTLNVANMIKNVESNLSITIPTNEKAFIENQVTNVQTVLSSISNDTTLDTSNLDKIQNALETQLEDAHETISNASTNDTLTTVTISDTSTLITQGETLKTNTRPYFLDGLTKITSKSISLDENSSFSFTPVVKDDDNDVLTYSLNGPDKDLFTLHANIGVITSNSFDYENPTDFNTNNTYLLQLTVSDGKVKEYLDLTISIKNTDDNTPTLSDISNVTIDKNSSTHTITLSGNDLDGTAITYTINAIQKDVLFTLNIDNNKLEITPILNKYGTDTITVNASSNGKSTSKQFTLTIQDTGALVIPSDIELPTPPMMPNL